MLIAKNVEPVRGSESEAEQMRGSLLARCVFRRVAEIVDGIDAAGAVPEDWLERCQQFEEVLACKADRLLYPHWKTETQRLEIEEIFQGLCWVIAVLAFVKGGVEIFGTRYGAKFETWEQNFGRSKT